jgi:hypothetical protein
VRVNGLSREGRVSPPATLRSKRCQVSLSHRRLVTLIVSVLVTLSATTTRSWAQAPGSGWAVVPTPERTIKSLYWQLFDVTEVWTRIVPRIENGAGKLPASLIFYATVPGNQTLPSAQILRPPQEIMVLAQPDPLAVLPIPSLSFVLLTDSGERFDLIERGVASRLLPRCDSCSVEAILARLDSDTFRSLAKSKTMTAKVLGFKCVLDQGDMSALGEFARTIKSLE